MRCITRKPEKHNANIKGADQPALLCRLISAIDVHCLDRIIAINSTSKSSRFQLGSPVAQCSRVLDSRPKRHRLEPHRCHCVVCFQEQDTLILA